MHCEESGVSDHLAFTERHGLMIARSIVQNLNVKSSLLDNSLNRQRPYDPLFSTDELNGIIPIDHRRTLNMYHVLARVLDKS